MKDLQVELARREREHRYRVRRVVGGPQGPKLRLDGREMVAFCSNDYLGLAADPRVADAFVLGVRKYGTGSGAAHLVSGHSRAHHALEDELAEFTGRECALLFSTGYMANLGAITALVGRGDHVFEDRLNHASLLDGGLLSRARLHRFQHADVQSLKANLQGAQGQKLVVTDGVFSMDGDVAPLAALVEACAHAQAWLMVDDAHGLGVLGPEGRGSLACGQPLTTTEVPVLMGTLGKAFGTAGAFVAGSRDLVETLIQTARSYIYTTATPPAVAEATRASLRIARAEEWRRERLRALVTRFRREVGTMGLELMASDTPIQPIVARSSQRAIRWSTTLEAKGILVTAIRPPTVPHDQARLRVTFSAAHTDAQLDQLLDGLHELARLAA